VLIMRHNFNELMQISRDNTDTGLGTELDNWYAQAKLCDGLQVPETYVQGIEVIDWCRRLRADYALLKVKDSDELRCGFTPTGVCPITCGLDRWELTKVVNLYQEHIRVAKGPERTWMYSQRVWNAYSQMADTDPLCKRLQFSSVNSRPSPRRVDWRDIPHTGRGNRPVFGS